MNLTFKSLDIENSMKITMPVFVDNRGQFSRLYLIKLSHLLG